MQRSFWGLLLLFISQGIHARDVYTPISKTILKNGAVLWLAPNPSAQTFRLEFTYNVGSGDESEGESGVAHLVEHMMFRDHALSKNMSYIQVLEDAGAVINAYTYPLETTYFAEITPEKQNLVVETFSRMLIGRSWDSEILDKCKGEVRLEIGWPNTTLGSVAEIFLLNPFSNYESDFWTTEMRLKTKAREGDDHRVSLSSLDIADAQGFYDSYYHPNNLTIYASGNFNVASIRKILSERFGTTPTSRTKHVRIFDKPDPRKQPYVNSRKSDNVPLLTKGIVFWQINAIEEMALRIYFNYLSNLLMKDIRNRHAATYTASDIVESYKGSGYAVVSMEIPRDKFNFFADKVRARVPSQLMPDKFSDVDIKNAIKLYKERYILKENSARAMSNLAHELNQNLEEYKESRTPQELLNALGPQKFRETLASILNHSASYEETWRPPFFDEDEDIVFYSLSFMAFIVFFRTILNRHNDPKKVRYGRIIRFSWATLVKGFLVLVLFKMAIFTTSEFFLSLKQSFDLRSNLFFNEYATTLMKQFVLVAYSFAFLSMIPRKILVVDDQLKIKYMSLRTRSIALKQIVSIEVLQPNHLLSHINRTTHYFPWGLWKKGVLVKVSDGSRIYLRFRNPQEVAADLIKLMPAKINLHIPQTPEPDTSVKKVGMDVGMEEKMNVVREEEIIEEKHDSDISHTAA